MVYIGCHLSVTGGYEAMGQTMSRFGGNTFAWFTRNPRGGRTKPIEVKDAGYDLVNDLDGVLRHFDDVVGLSKLKAVHFNDSKNSCGSHKDRHEKLGKGAIGMEAMRRIVLHPALQGLPFILETPNDDAGYMEEIHTVQSWMTR